LPAFGVPLFAILGLGSLFLTVAVLPLCGQSAAKSGSPSEQSGASSRPSDKDPEKKLAELARALREEETVAAYARLSRFADTHASNELGARAALALGYYDFTKGRPTQALQWLDRAARQMESAPDKSLLQEYARYWRAQVNRALGRNAEALSELQTFRREFPESVMTEQVVQSLAETALVLGEAGQAVTALDAYERAASKPSLLLLRARAREEAGRTAAAASDYLTLYYRFPLSEEAKTAGQRIPALALALGEGFPHLPPEQQVAQQLGRAAAFYEAHRWRDARSEYENLLPQLRKRPVGVELERAELRLAESSVQLRAAPSVLASLALTDAGLDAERLYALSQFYRAHKQEAEMLAVVEQLAARYPQSYWTEEGLFAAGNYFWVNLDRKRATSFYQRLLEKFPRGKTSQAAHWRIAWVTYLERGPEAAALLEEHLRRFPGSAYTVNTLYWLGRAAERDANAAHARSFYLKAQERFPQTYFGRRSAERLQVLGAAPVNSADFLSLIPPPPALPHLDQAIPPAASERWARAQELRTIAFDASGELELRAGFAATGSLRLLWEAAQAALDAGHYSVAMATARFVYPEFEARKIEDVPLAVWRTAFPLPFETSVKRAAARNHLDPMLVAGVIRQESAFQADAVSRAGAVGLMQLLPKTARKLARPVRLRYARAKLFDPEYNLKLGTFYLAELVKTVGSLEAALAAFNAGEERVAAWKTEHNFEEQAEFVESIPFTETRDYVQIVMRNAETYRLVYGEQR